VESLLGMRRLNSSCYGLNSLPTLCPPHKEKEHISEMVHRIHHSHLCDDENDDE